MSDHEIMDLARKAHILLKLSTALQKAILNTFFDQLILIDKEEEEHNFVTQHPQ